MGAVVDTTTITITITRMGAASSSMAAATKGITRRQWRFSLRSKHIRSHLDTRAIRMARSSTTGATTT